MDYVSKAYFFAKAAHEGQTRKYSSGTPYLYHPLSVFSLVLTATTDPEILAAAILHDTVEDTNVTLDQIEDEFSTRVMNLVDDLTDVSTKKDGNRAARKQIDRAHTAKAHPDAKTIKLADLIDNSFSIVNSDPTFAKIYMVEKVKLLAVLRDGAPALWAKAWDIAMNYFVQNPDVQLRKGGCS